MFTAKKSKQRNIKFQLISAILIAGVVFTFSAKPWATGQTTDDLRRQIDAKQKQLSEINKKITDYQSQISQSQKQANTLKNQINTINLEVAKAQAEIEATESQVDATNLEIADVTNKIVESQEAIEKQKNVLKALIADINDLDQRSPLEIALENDNFQQFLDQVQYNASIQEQSQETLSKIKQLEADLKVRQAGLKTEKDKLDSLLSQLNIQNANLNGQRAAKQDLLNQTAGQEKAYKRLLTATEAEEKALADEINNLDNEIARRLGNNKIIPGKGQLAWPMQGTLTQGYGNTGFTSLGYSFHNGIDIAAPAGKQIYAAADGTVVATGKGEGAYGNWVAIKHTTGKFTGRAIVTLYAHMSSFLMKTGQTVEQGDLVGFEGNTGNTTRLLYGPHRGFHIHFTVFDANGFGVAPGTLTKTYGPYQVPYGATYNPLSFF